MEKFDKKVCKVYIDESGDLGVRKGTRWFVISAVIITEEDEKEMRKIVESIKYRLNIKVIHFKNIREFNKKLYIVSKIKLVPFTFINVIVDTDKLEVFDGGKTYIYLSELLMKRVSCFLSERGYLGKVVFSSRNTKRDNELTAYLTEKMINCKVDNLFPDTIHSVKSEKMEKLDMLQVADVCAGAMSRSLEPDSLGFTYPCLINNLNNHLYTCNGDVDGYGINYYLNEMKPDSDYYDSSKPCNYHNKN